MTPRYAIGELELMGFQFTLLSGAVVHYRRSDIGVLDDRDRERTQKLLDYLAANKPGMISVLERRDLSAPGDVVLIDHISEYLKQHGYRVVRATWPEREPRPLLIVEDRV